MSADEPTLTDVRDMYSVHEAFRRGLGDARSQLVAVPVGDTTRARHFADYFCELLWLLHAHHAGEDVLLYPLLVERVPEKRALFERMDAQHDAVTESLNAAEVAAQRFGDSGSVTDREALADACDALAATLTPHLDEEEVEILPFAARHIAPAEWGQLPQHAFSMYTGTRLWLPFGLAIETMPQDMRDGMFAHESPVTQMWAGGGSAAFAAEMTAIRAGAH